uniref:KIB1-4 beta-propeller domain-containing protein n=1 Tax=Hordeum vulgare subsp. vulgare TaxID=112509 RepID=A0A8I6WWZ4_HORVV
MDWSSLPPELIHHIAGGLLDTADLDCYMALRAICHNWRAATDDPTNNMDRRFRPRNWVMLDYPSHDKDTRVLVNTETARFHVRNIPMLRNYYVVSVTGDGLLVLAAKEAPHAACVLNPFTGYMVRFAARMRPSVTAAVVSSSSPLYLIIYCTDSSKLYRANPGSKEFVRYKKKYPYPLVRKAVQGCVAIAGHQNVLPPLPAVVVAKIDDLMTAYAEFPDNHIGMAAWPGCFVVESAGETLIIFKLENRRMEVFKMDKDGNTLEKVNSIGSRAIFISNGSRCLSVDATQFPSIEANCIYLTPHLAWPCTEIYHLEHGAQGLMSMAMIKKMECGDNFLIRSWMVSCCLRTSPLYL